MSAVTLSTPPVARVRDKADMPTAGFVADSGTGCTPTSTKAYSSCDKLLPRVRGDYMEKPARLRTRAATSPARGLLQASGRRPLAERGTTVTLSAYTRRERNALSNTRFSGTEVLPGTSSPRWAESPAPVRFDSSPPGFRHDRNRLVHSARCSR